MNPAIVKIFNQLPARRPVILNLIMGASIYHAGYHIYKNKDHIINKYLELLRK